MAKQNKKAPSNRMFAVDTFVLIIILLVATSAVGGAGYTALKVAGRERATAQASEIIITASVERVNALDFDSLRQKKLKLGQDKKTNLVRSLSAKERSIPLSKGNFRNATEAGNQFVKEYAQFFGASDSRKLVAQTPKKDKLGMSHVAYQQKINGVPVFGGSMLVHVAEDLSVKSGAGKVLTDTAVNTSARVSARSAGTTVKNLWQQRFGGQAPTVSAGKLYVFNKSLLDKKAENKNHLVWEIKAKGKGQSETYYVDAKTGNVLMQINNVKHISRRVYNCDSSRERGICTNLWGTDASAEENDRAEGWVAANAGDVDRVYQMVGQAHSYFESIHGTDGANGRDGLGDGADGHPFSRTDAYANWLIPTTWDGDCPNAAFLDNKMLFCPTTVSLGVVGHEYSHAVSNFYGRGLVYAFESGAIEEAIADVMGQGLINNINGAPTWQMVLTPGNVIRDLSNPETLSKPGRYYSDNFYCGERDQGGVHTNSNVIGHAAYLMATGNNFNGCSIGSIGFDKVEKIFFRALDWYLLSNADFNDLYWALDNACSDLYDASVCANVRRALQAVEIDQPGPCGGDAPDPVPACSAPALASVSANAGYYRTNDNINLRFNFSRPVQSSGPVGVLAHMGNSSATTTICSLDLSELSDEAECSFKVQSGYNSVRFRIDELDTTWKQTIVDEDGVRMTEYTAEDNLSKGTVVIDTEAPYGSVNINNGDGITNYTSVNLTHTARDNNSGTEFYRVSNDGGNFSPWLEFAVSSVWNLYNAEAGGGTEPAVAGSSPRQVYVQFKDKAGNVSKSVSDDITYAPLTLQLRNQPFREGETTTNTASEEPQMRAVDTRANTVWTVTTTDRTTAPSGTQAPSQPPSPTSRRPTTIALPPSAAVPTVREPDFTMSSKASKLTVYLNGSINYWGKGAGCSFPRATDPIIVSWGDGNKSSIKPADKTFSASHEYKKSGNYEIIVTLTNGCSGYSVKLLTVKIGA